jgi:CBS domain-containing protein
MTRPAVTCRATDNLDAAARLMWEGDCGFVPVVDDHDSLVGIITDRDICMAAYTRGQTLREIPVEAAMAGKVFSCHPHDSVESVEELMGEKQVRRVPITDDDNHPIGVVSLNDIARHAASSRTNGRRSSDVTRTLAAICQPRKPPRVSTAPARAAERVGV